MEMKNNYKTFRTIKLKFFVGKKGNIVSRLDNGKIVLPSFRVQPGEEVWCDIVEHERYAIAYPHRRHDIHYIHVDYREKKVRCYCVCDTVVYEVDVLKEPEKAKRIVKMAREKGLTGIAAESTLESILWEEEWRRKVVYVRNHLDEILRTIPKFISIKEEDMKIFTAATILGLSGFRVHDKFIKKLDKFIESLTLEQKLAIVLKALGPCDKHDDPLYVKFSDIWGCVKPTTSEIEELEIWYSDLAVIKPLELLKRAGIIVEIDVPEKLKELARRVLEDRDKMLEEAEELMRKGDELASEAVGRPISLKFLRDYGDYVRVCYDGDILDPLNCYEYRIRDKEKFKKAKELYSKGKEIEEKISEVLEQKYRVEFEKLWNEFVARFRHLFETS